MIDINDNMKNAYDKSTTQVDKIIVDDKEYFIECEYYDDVYENGNIFGTAICRAIDFEIENSIELEEKEIDYYTGILVDGNIEWIYIGKFIVATIEPNDTTDTNKVTAMDYLIKSNIPYVTELDYKSGTITMQNVLDEVCNNSGLELASDVILPNSNFIVDSNQFSDGTLNRQVIQAIAQINGCIAKIKNDNKLHFINPKNNTIVCKTFRLNEYEEVEIKRNTHPINIVSLGMENVEGENVVLRDEQAVQTQGENVLAISDNPFAYTQDKRQELIQAIFDTVKGFEYTAFSLNTQGLPYLETCDKVQILDKEGNYYNSYVFRFNYTSPNGLDSTIEAPSITKATINYQNLASAIDVARRTEIRVDKDKQEISLELSKKTNNNEIFARINMYIQGKGEETDIPEDIDKSVIHFESNSLTWESDHSSLNEEGILQLNNNSEEPYIYTPNDIMSALSYIKGESSLTDELKELYDVDGDGEVTVIDVTKMQNIYNGTQESDKYPDTKIIFNPLSPSEFIKLVLGDALQCRIGLNEIYNYTFRGMNLFLGTFADMNTAYGVSIDGENGVINVSSEHEQTATIIDAGKVDAYNVLCSSGGGKGYALHGIDTSHTYRCSLANSSGTNYLKFLVDSTSFPIIQSIENSGQQITRMRLLVSYIEFIVPGYGAYSINGIAQSDERLKNNIKESKISGLDAIKKIQHIEFDWKETKQALRRGHEVIGHSADQIKKVLGNDIVYSTEQPKDQDLEYENLLQIDYDRLMPYITKAIQELSEENYKLQKKFNEQYNIIQDLKERIKKLEESK